jgi:hypothetical protein
MNHKKLYRLYCEEKLMVRPRGGRKRALGTRAPMLLPDTPPSLRFTVAPLQCAGRYLYSVPAKIDNSPAVYAPRLRSEPPGQAEGGGGSALGARSYPLFITGNSLAPRRFDSSRPPTPKGSSASTVLQTSRRHNDSLSLLHSSLLTALRVTLPHGGFFIFRQPDLSAGGPPPFN